MNIYFFETTNSPPHLETSFELAKKHLDKGDNVYYYFLGHSVTYSEFLRKKRLFGFSMPERKAAALMGENFYFIEPSPASVRRYFPRKNFHSIEELREFRYKNYNAGLSTLSSLVSRLRQSKPNVKEHQDLINEILGSGISIYEFVLKILESNTVNLAYLFNGRFANDRAILDAVIQAEIPYLIHELGSNKWRYSVNPFMPHDVEKVKLLMINSWASAELCSKKNIAEQFFEDRRDGKEQGWKSFIIGQRRDWLPDRIASSKKMIAYFSSSDDEYVAVGDIVKWKRWPNQLAAVQDLLEIVSECPELYLIIRMHPHLAQKSQEDLDEWMHLSIPDNASLIMPTDPTDTYALIEQSDVVVTCGSTVGIESVFWGTPSICLGPSLYSHLDSVYLPNDKDDLRRMLLGNDLSVNSERALPYGYFMATYGEEFIYYKPSTLLSGTFLGVNLQLSSMHKYVHWVKSLVAKVVKSNGD
jgi:hypothetical protein